MGSTRRIGASLFSRTVAAGILGFLLSIFATEILYVVPSGLEIEVAELLLIPIILLMIYVVGFFGELRRRWWEWRRYLGPIRVGVLSGYYDDTKKGTECKPQFSTNSGWLGFLSASDNGKKAFEVARINWSAISSKYAVIINPFGEIYLEVDKRNLSTFENIKDFVADGGIFCCTGGFPFYYYWDSITAMPIDTTPKTRTREGDIIEDTRFFTDSLVTKDFGAIITNDPPAPTLISAYQEKKPDIEFFGNLANIGGTDKVREFRSLSEETRGIIAGLRVKHGDEVKFPMAAIAYGQGYLIVAGMSLETEVEFKKLGEGIISFTNQIAGLRKSKWQKNYEIIKRKFSKL